MKRLLKWTAALFAFLVIGVVCAWSGYHLVVGADPLVVELFGGADVVELIRSADKVEAYRIEGDLYAKPHDEHAPRIRGYEVLSGPVLVDSESHDELAKALTAAWTYWWIGGKPCIPQPGIALVFTKGDAELEILVCFECDLLVVPRHNRSERVEDFDYGRPALVRIAKRLFPDDAAIQGLEE